MFASANSTAMTIASHIAFHEFEGVANNEEERERLGADLGNKPLMLLRNHGILTTGQTAAEAFIAAFYLEKACQYQILAQSAGQPLVMPPDDGLGRNRASGGNDDSWPALLRMLDQTDSSYRN